jgi:ferredoxin
VKVRVIEGKCSGHARCAAVAPEVYVLDDEGYLVMAPTDIAPGLEGQARRGARACPERAIEVIEE